MSTPLRPIDNEQRPNVTCLVVHAGKSLHISLILRNEEDRLIHIPSNLFVCDEGGIAQRVLGCSVPHFVDARKIGAGGGA
jgi:hypothetical protein